MYRIAVDARRKLDRKCNVKRLFVTRWIVPPPQSATGRDELFNALRAWVERGVAPERIDLYASSGNLSLPIFMYPKKAVYAEGNRNASASYICR